MLAMFATYVNFQLTDGGAGVDAQDLPDLICWDVASPYLRVEPACASVLWAREGEELQPVVAENPFRYSPDHVHHLNGR